MDHPPIDVLSRFVWRTASREENRRVVRHLLTLCPECAAAVRSIRPEPVDPAEYDAALDRFEEMARTLAGAGRAGWSATGGGPRWWMAG